MGIESRGFLLGAAAAVSLGVGFVGVRKADGLFPGATLTADAEEDYRGLRHRLRMQAVLTPGDRVLLVDQLHPAAREALGRVTSLVTAEELGDPDE